MAVRRTRVWTRVQRNGGFHAMVPRWGEGRGDAGCRFWDAGFGIWDAGFGMCELCQCCPLPAGQEHVC